MLYFLLVLCTRLGYDTNKCVGVCPSIQPGRVSAAPGESRVYDRRMDGHQTDAPRLGLPVGAVSVSVHDVW